MLDIYTTQITFLKLEIVLWVIVLFEHLKNILDIHEKICTLPGYIKTMKNNSMCREIYQKINRFSLMPCLCVNDVNS